MPTTVSIPCSAVLLPTKAELANVFIQLANSEIEEIQDKLEDIEKILGYYPLSVPNPLYGTLSIPEIEWERRVGAMIQEYHLYIQAKIMELINDVLSISFEVSVMGLTIDVVRVFSDPTYIPELKSQIAANVDQFYALLPEEYKLFDGKFGLVSDDLKADAVWSYIMSQLNKGALGLIHGAIGGLIDKFDEIWDALGLPSLPSLTDLNVKALIQAIIDDTSKDVEAKIEALKALSIAGFNVMDLIGGEVNEFIVSAERQMDRLIERIRDFGEEWPKFLIQEYIQKIKKFLDAIGLGAILDWAVFDFCKFLKVIGMPSQINLTSAIELLPLADVSTVSLPTLSPVTIDRSGTYKFTATEENQTVFGGIDIHGTNMTLDENPQLVTVDGEPVAYIRTDNVITLINGINIGKNVYIIE